jgi:hypothetical protein
MFGVSRRASTAFVAAAAAALAAGAVVLPVLRHFLNKPDVADAAKPGSDAPASVATARREQDSLSGGALRAEDFSGNEHRECSKPEEPGGEDRVTGSGSTEPSPGAGACQGTRTGGRSSLVQRARKALWSRAKRALKYTRGGLVPVVWLLLALTAVTAVFGWVNRPETTVPQPGESNIEVDFSPGHPAVAPVIVSVLLSRDDVSSGTAGGITMTIDLQGQDLTHADWSVTADVPSGAESPYPDSGVSIHTFQGTTYATAAPGPQTSGKYEVDLEWNDLRSGPLQVIGANMAAVLPQVAVIDYTTSEAEQVPTTQVTVNEALEPGTDFTYQSGPAPDQIIGYEWQWKPVTGTINGPNLNTEFTVEAKSAMLDGEGQVTEFYSGIAFGIAAAAAISAVVEFVKAQRSEPKRRTRRRRRNRILHPRPRNVQPLHDYTSPHGQLREPTTIQRSEGHLSRRLSSDQVPCCRPTSEVGSRLTGSIFYTPCTAVSSGAV